MTLEKLFKHKLYVERDLLARALRVPPPELFTLARSMGIVCFDRASAEALRDRIEASRTVPDAVASLTTDPISETEDTVSWQSAHAEEVMSRPGFAILTLRQKILLLTEDGDPWLTPMVIWWLDLPTDSKGQQVINMLSDLVATEQLRTVNPPQDRAEWLDRCLKAYVSNFPVVRPAPGTRDRFGQRICDL